MRKRQWRRKSKKTWGKRKRSKAMAFKKGRLVRVTRNVQLPDLVVSAGPNSYITQNYHFDISQLNNYTDFTNLFERYRIKAVKLTFIPGQSNNIDNVSKYRTTMLTHIQQSSGKTPATLAAFMESNNTRIHAGNKTVSVYIRHPFISSNVYQSALSSGYVEVRNKLINMANYTVPHYGLNVLCETPGVGPAETTEYQRYRVFAKYYMEFADAS